MRSSSQSPKVVKNKMLTAVISIRVIMLEIITLTEIIIINLSFLRIRNMNKLIEILWDRVILYLVFTRTNKRLIEAHIAHKWIQLLQKESVSWIKDKENHPWRAALFKWYLLWKEKQADQKLHRSEPQIDKYLRVNNIKDYLLLTILNKSFIGKIWIIQ